MLGNQRAIGRARRQKRVRKDIRGTDERPRVCVYKSLKHIYAQVISDQRGQTLVSASTLSKGLQGRVAKGRGIEAARQVGLDLARLCKEKSIARVVFDRNGFLYHGRVKALAEAAREGGLIF